jgi:sulfur carrier protein
MTSDLQQLIQFNGESVAIEATQTVADFIQNQALVGRRFVVVINDEIVPKSSWENTQVQAGDQVDIMSPISGG